MRLRKAAGVRLLADIHAVPPAQPPDGSLTGWIWLIVVLAIVVGGGVLLGSRR